MKKYIALILAAGLALSLTACKNDETAETVAEATPEPEQTSNVYIGTLNAIEETKVIPNGKGQIINCPYEVGDYVSQGVLLYELDDNGLSDTIATTKNSIAKSELSISTAQENVANLKIYAPESGILRGFSIKQGERVNAAKIAEIADEDTVIALVPFNSAQKSNIHIGDAATVTSAELMGSVSGVVTRIYDSRSSAVEGSSLYNVEITVSNPGGLYAGLSVSANIGGIEAPVSGVIEDSETVSVVSKGSGNAKAVYVKDGQRVKKGELLLELENSSLNSTLQRAYLDKKDLEIKLSSLEADYRDLFVYAPVSGTITAKHKSLNDNITSNTESVMTISNDSQLVLKVNVNEETLSGIHAGMSVDVSTADGSVTVPAVISSIDTTGSISSGEKCYPVTVTMDNNGTVLPGAAVSVDFGGVR